MKGQCALSGLSVSCRLQLSNCYDHQRAHRWLFGKESAYQAGDVDLITGLRRSPGEGNGKPLQCSCLENSMDRGFWQATVHGVAQESDRT